MHVIPFTFVRGYYVQMYETAIKKRPPLPDGLTPTKCSFSVLHAIASKPRDISGADGSIGWIVQRLNATRSACSLTRRPSIFEEVGPAVRTPFIIAIRRPAAQVPVVL